MSTPARSRERPLTQVESPRNTAACHTPRPSISSDTKSNDAAAQAIQLGSQSSWSEAFSPRPFHSSMAQIEDEDESEQEYEEELDDTLEPPPTYANATRPQELPATPLLGSVQAPTRRDVEAQSDMYGPRSIPASLYEPESGEQSPLLGHSTLGDSPSSWWMPERKQSKRVVLYIIGLLALILGISGGIALASVTRSHNAAPPAPTATYIPTDRVYERHETLGSIRGGYKLYDKLALSTTTGSIDIEIDPQPGSEPAMLLLASDLGSVTVRLASTWKHNAHRPRRPIFTEIHTFTGTVTAELPLSYGSSIEINTTVGTQHLNILADGATLTDPISNLSTTSSTGNQYIQVIALDATQSLSSLRARHRSCATGALNVVYPDNWLGVVYARSNLGDVDVQGEDLVYNKVNEMRVRARRGRDEDLNEVKLLSDGTGSAKFRC